MPSIPRPRLRRSARIGPDSGPPNAAPEPNVEIVLGEGVAATGDAPSSAGLRWINIEQPGPVDRAWLAKERRRLGELGVGEPGDHDVAPAGALLDPAEAVQEGPPGGAVGAGHGHEGSATTRFSSRPMPSISVTTRWPAER